MKVQVSLFALDTRTDHTLWSAQCNHEYSADIWLDSVTVNGLDSIYDCTPDHILACCRMNDSEGREFHIVGKNDIVYCDGENTLIPHTAEFQECLMYIQDILAKIDESV